MVTSPSEVAEEFCAMVDRIQGTYLDASMAMGELARSYMGWDIERLEALAKRERPLDPREFNPDVTYTGSQDGTPVELHTTTLQELIRRNGVQGENRIFLANMCVVAVYQYWEDGYRSRLAAALGVETTSLKAEVLGELRHLRRSIIHNRGRALPEVGRARILRSFGVGDPIRLDHEDVRSLVREVTRAVRTLAREKSGEPAP